MQRVTLLAALAALVGCAGTSADAPSMTNSMGAAQATAGTSVAATGASPVTGMDVGRSADAPPIEDISWLPPAPWSETPISAHEAPEAMIRAWQSADNRTWCAPVAPRTLGRGEGARARVTTAYGGWAVEYDRPGARGMRANGQLCSFCGRGAFGIAGTEMSPAEIVEDTEAMEMPAPSFRDGSSSAIERGDHGVAAATITIAGQGCVYQVWSFFGEAHVQELVQELRLISLDDNVALSERP